MSHLNRFPISDRWRCSTKIGDGGFEWVGCPLKALRQWTAAVAHLHPTGPLPIDYASVARLLEQKGAFTWGDDFSSLQVAHPSRQIGNALPFSPQGDRILTR